LEIKKVTLGWVRWVRWMFQHSDLVLHQKLLDRQGVVCRHVVLVKNPWAFLPHFMSSSSHPFMKVCQNFLVVDLVNGLTFRHPIHMNYLSDVEKTIIVALNLDLLCCAFFCLGERGLFQCTDWCLLCGLYWKNHDSSQVITFSKTFGRFQCFEECQHKCSFKFPFVQGRRVSALSSSTRFSCWNCYVKSVERFLVNVN